MKRLLHAPTVIKRCPFQGREWLMFRRLAACVPGWMGRVMGDPFRVEGIR